MNILFKVTDFLPGNGFEKQNTKQKIIILIYFIFVKRKMISSTLFNLTVLEFRFKNLDYKDDETMRTQHEQILVQTGPYHILNTTRESSSAKWL